MKRLLIVVVLVMVFGVSLVQAQQYEVAPAGTKAFTTAAGVASNTTISLDIWLTDADAPQNAGGAWLDFKGSADDISYVSAGRALTDGSEGLIGPWRPDGGVIVNEPAGRGTLLMQVLNLTGAAPDGDGDLIVGTVTLEKIVCNDATINITTIPTVATWTPLDDATVGGGAIVIYQVCDCITDADCDDGIFCNGVERCEGDACDSYCSPGTDPCDDGNPCTAGCDWETQACNYDVCGATSPFDLCCREPICRGASPCYCFGDFDCDEDVDAEDIRTFLEDFGRNYYSNACTNENPCNADFDCDHDVDAEDIPEFLEDVGRSQYKNPCPPCIAWWCGYPQ